MGSLTRKALACIGVLAALPGCRGRTSEDPPFQIRPMRNMFIQDKAKPQRENTFFSDHRAMRPAVEGTVSTSAPIGPEEDRLHSGKEGGAFLKELPVPVTWDLLRRGQERFNIYCSPCHDRTGSGQGMAVVRAAGAIVKPPSYHEDRIRDMPVGQLFSIITNGERTMPSYAYQVPVADRWAIVAYIRALQRSQRTVLEDVPQELRSSLK